MKARSFFVRVHLVAGIKSHAVFFNFSAIVYFKMRI